MAGSIQNAQKAAELQRLRDSGKDTSNHPYRDDLERTARQGVRSAREHLDALDKH